MKLLLIKLILLIVFFVVEVQANDFESEYEVSTSGIKIGKFSWSLKTSGDKYKTEIYLKNSGFFSKLYKFEGKYESNGLIKDSYYKAINYKQFWKTKKKIKIVEMSFNDNFVKILQEPVEKETARINFDELFQYYDPITSFINILNGKNNIKTIDGRRIYVMEKIRLNETEKININIKDYKNIWADHKRNDLKKIEFILSKDELLPVQINIHFKKRVFKLKKS